MTTKEFAHHYGISENRVRRALLKRHVRSVQLGGRGSLHLIPRPSPTRKHGDEDRGRTLVHE